MSPGVYSRAETNTVTNININIPKDNLITLTSDDSRNIGDDSHNSMDVSRTCANRTLRESSVNHRGRYTWIFTR